MTKKESIAQSKEQNKSPENDHKEREVNELPDREYKISIIKMLNELGKMRHKQNENINKIDLSQSCHERQKRTLYSDKRANSPGLCNNYKYMCNKHKNTQIYVESSNRTDETNTQQHSNSRRFQYSTFNNK